MLRSLVTVESAPFLSAPAKVVARTYPAVPHGDEPVEPLPLQQRPAKQTGVEICTASASNTPDLEMSRPGSPLEPGGVEVAQSVWDPYMNRFRFLSVCFTNFGNGMNDSAPGALIPYMEK